MDTKAFSSFHAGKSGLRKVLGDLEADIMEAVWARGQGARVTVREVVSDLRSTRDSAYTTVMTVMGTLAKKGLLAAHKTGMAYAYEATATRQQFTEQVVATVVQELLADFKEPALAHFAQAITEAPGPSADWASRIAELRAAEKARQGR